MLAPHQVKGGGRIWHTASGSRRPLIGLSDTCPLSFYFCPNTLSIGGGGAATVGEELDEDGWGDSSGRVWGNHHSFSQEQVSPVFKRHTSIMCQSLKKVYHYGDRLMEKHHTKKLWTREASLSSHSGRQCLVPFEIRIVYFIHTSFSTMQYELKGECSTLTLSFTCIDRYFYRNRRPWDTFCFLHMYKTFIYPQIFFSKNKFCSTM